MVMAQQTALIVGASRGLGLGLAREYLGRGWQVIGTVRGSSRTGLHDLACETLAIENLDIDEADQIAALRQRLHGRALDLLFVNAGVTNEPSERIGTVATETFVRVMRTNALSPMRVVETLAPLVTPHGTIAAMSSGLGSVANNRGGGWEVYRASKAALNMLMRSYAARAAGGRTLLLIAPGWVRTDMGGPSAGLDVETSTRGIAEVIARSAGHGGLQYLDYQGRTVPW
jgi:NAD(P)-dependent dehydrogenase (short-subunit alcohol dehydrogenase family)